MTLANLGIIGGLLYLAHLSLRLGAALAGNTAAGRKRTEERLVQMQTGAGIDETKARERARRAMEASR